MFLFRCMGRISKCILRGILRLALALLVLGLTWTGAVWMRGDDVLNPKISDFYKHEEQAYEGDNIAVAALGLVAPDNTQDTYQWALDFIRQDIQKHDRYEAAMEQQVRDTSNFFSRLGLIHSTYEKNTSPGLRDQISVIPEHVQFKGKTAGFTCLINQGWDPASMPYKNQPCYSKEDSIKIIQANSLMLARYRELSRYGRFIQIPQGINPTSPELIAIHEVFLANLVLSAEQAPEAAFREWINNATMLKIALSDENNMPGRSVFMVMYKQSQRSLPALLPKDKHVLEQYKEPLEQVLGTFGPKQMNIDRMMKAEYRIYGAFVDKLSNGNRNKFYDFSQDIMALSEQPASEFSHANQEFKKRYDDTVQLRDWHSPIFGAISNMMINGMAVGSDLLGVMHTIDATNRLLAIYLQARIEGITPATMADFVTRIHIVDPFTQQPFRYNASTGMLYFINPDAPNMVNGLRINP